MKRFLCILLTVVMLLTLLVPSLAVSATENTPVALASASVNGEQFTVMSCNIRYSTSGDGYASLKWVVGTNDKGEYVLRVDNAITQILEISPDIIGFQEFNFTGNSDVDTKLYDALTDAGYGVIMMTYTNGTQNQTPIFYKTAKFNAVTTTGAQGILQYTHHTVNGTATSEQIHVKVVAKGTSGTTKSGKNTAGASLVELCANDEYAPQTLTATEIKTALNVSNFSASQLSSITYNSDGSVTYSGKTYANGAYHTRAFLTAVPGKDAGKSLTWGILESKTSGQRLLMMSTHMVVFLNSFASKADDCSRNLIRAWNQENAKELLATAKSVWEAFGRLPTIAVGDFNMGNTHPSYSLLSEVFDDSARLAPDAVHWEATALNMDNVKTLITDSTGNAVTHNGDKLYDVSVYRNDMAPTPNYPIDHIFCSQGDLQALSYNVLNDTPAQRVISDHYALLTTFVLPNVQTPACSHNSGIYRLEQTVTLSKENSADTIYYTLDGTNPAKSRTRKTYTGALTLYGDVRLRAVAYRDGQYSLERDVCFATGAELMITEVIKNNATTYIELSNGTSAAAYGEMFAGFEVVNTSKHTIDLARYTFWHDRATDKGSGGTAPDASVPNDSDSAAKLRIVELGRYLLAAGETAFIWIVNPEIYVSKLIYNENNDASFAVEFVTESNYEEKGLSRAAIGKVLYKPDIAKQAFEYATGSTVSANLIVPLDRTAATFIGNGDGEVYVTNPDYKRFDEFAESITANGQTISAYKHNNLSNAFDSYAAYYSRLSITYPGETTPKNAFAGGIVNLASGFSATYASQGSFYLTNTVDAATGNIIGTSTKFTLQGYGLGTLETAEQALVNSLVHDLSYRQVTWNVNGTLTTEYVLRNAVPAFKGSTDKPSTQTERYVFTGWSPCPAAAPLSADGKYLTGEAATYVAQYAVNPITRTLTFLDASGNVLQTVEVAKGTTHTLPDAPEGDGIFCGWHASNGVFLPANGAHYVTIDNTFTPIYLSFTTWAGAQMRTYWGSTGLRFRSSVTMDSYNALSGAVSNVTVGTFIVPQRYVDNAGAFDVAAFAKYIDVEAPLWYGETASEYILAGSVANVLPQNYQLDYTACGYARFTYSDGTAGMVYATRAANAGYSVYDVAYAAYNDRTATPDATHTFAIDKMGQGVSYSPYTASQLTMMRPYLDHVLDLGIRAGELISISDTDYYTSPLAKCSWSYDEALDRIVVTAESADAWSNLYACYMDDDKVRFSVNGATLYIEYVIYSDFY